MVSPRTVSPPLLLLLVSLCLCSLASRTPPSSWLVTEQLEGEEDISHLPELVNVALERPVVRPVPFHGGGRPPQEGRELEGALRSVTDGFVHGKARLGTALELSPEHPSLVVNLGWPRRVEEVLFYSELGDYREVSAQRVAVSFLDEEGEEIIPAKELSSLTKLFRWASAGPDLAPEARYVCLTLADMDLPLAITEVEVYSPAEPDDPQVPEAHKIQLLLTFFASKSPHRAKEQKESLVRNLRNPYIAGADVVTESCREFPFQHPKIRLRCFAEQPTYGDFFQHANEHLLGRTVLLTNGDIVFTSSLAHVHRRLAARGEFFVFHRWNLPCSNHAPNKGDVFNFCEAAHVSYDSYIFRPPTSRSLVEALDLPMNRKHAEHEAVFHLIMTQGWNATNPCVDLIGYHNHCSELREWKRGIIKERNATFLTSIVISPASAQEPDQRYLLLKKTKNLDGSFSNQLFTRGDSFSFHT